MPGATITQPIVSAAERLPGDRRAARMGAVDDARVAGAHHADAAAEGLIVRSPPNAIGNYRRRIVTHSKRQDDRDQRDGGAAHHRTTVGPKLTNLIYELQKKI